MRYRLRDKFWRTVERTSVQMELEDTQACLLRDMDEGIKSVESLQTELRTLSGDSIELQKHLRCKM